MHIRRERESGEWVRQVGAAALAAVLAGCASPGPPLPPSLKLPEVVTDLTAARIGDAVRLRWTTPERTTDKLLIAGPVTAEICRTVVTAAAAGSVAGIGMGKAVGARPCSAPVLRVEVKPGDSEAMDVLAGPLAAGGPAAGGPGLLAYQVQLMNAKGRTAGASAAVYALSGAAPGMVDALSGRQTKQGVMLEWRAGAAAEAIELDRVTVDAAGRMVQSVQAKSGLGVALAGQSKEAVEARLRGGDVDAGGTVDRTVERGRTYRYTAERVQRVTVGGQTLEARSAPSASVTVEVRDVFAPDTPDGLVAVPGFAEGAAGGSDARRPAIDLSWEPDMEARVAGYRVYRRTGDAGAWERLGDGLVKAPAYRDAAVVAGQRYVYRVTAVSEAGMESRASGEVEETAPGR